MSQFTIRLSILAACGTALLVIPAVTPVQASEKHMHASKHHRHWRQHAQVWPMEAAQPAPRSYGGDVCPGIGRSFDCKIWPPPFADDPDRKTSRF